MHYAGFDTVCIAINNYRTIPTVDAINFLNDPPAYITTSFISNWEILKKAYQENLPLTLEHFEYLGRTIKIIGETILREEQAHTEVGLNFLFSLYEDGEEND